MRERDRERRKKRERKKEKERKEKMKNVLYATIIELISIQTVKMCKPILGG